MQAEEQSNSESSNPFEKLAPEPPASSSKKKKEEREEQIVPINKHINLNIVREKKPRLVIDHMILEDFKSYAGKQKIGVFHGNFTSVVGPNGSGKSNLIEAMLFIFGFNASWMRLNKLKQLIHNSSTSTGNTMAAVEVHFKKLQQNQDDSLSEVHNFNLWIRRTVNASSVSKYYLNGRDSTQAQVKERLKEEGIDLANNRFLILQGEVEQISQMKQKSGDPDKPGLLEYLEEIIGSNVFIERIEECGRQYAQAEEQKHQKGQLMKIVESELKGMSKAKDQAVSYVKKEKKIFQLQNIFNQVLVALVKSELKKLTLKLSDLQKIKQRIISEERQKLKRQAERIKEVKKKKSEMQELEKQMNKHQQALNKMQVEDKHINQQVSFKSEDLVKFERKTKDADKEMEKIISTCQDIRNKLPKNKQILERKVNELEEIRAQLSNYDKPHLKQKIKDCEVTIAQNQLQNNTVHNKLQTVKGNLNKMNSGKDELAAKMQEYQKKLDQNQGIKQKIGKAVITVENMIHEKKNNVKAMNEKRNDMRNQLRHIENQLREQLNQSEEQGQMNNMFKQIMNQNMRGVIGRLGDLGSVSRQHDEIISTCCSKLDNIVCTDLETAKSVLDFLKRRKLGRATCIILDKIAEYRNYMAKRWENLPRSVRLFDVINFKTEEAKLAFYFALGDTVYCEDSDLGLDYSMKNEHQRRRVISKNKQRGGYITYEMNGLMVGSVPRRGGFQMKGGIKKKGKDQGQLKELQNRKKRLSQDMDEMSKMIESEQAQINEGQKDREQMKRQFTSIDEIIRECQEQLKDLGVMISKAQGKSDSHQFLEKEIRALEQAQKQLAKKKKGLEQELTKLENQQKKNQTKQIQALRQKYKEERAATSRLEKQSERERAQLESSIKRIDDLKKSKLDNQKMQQRTKREIDKLKNEQIQLETKVSQIFGKLSVLEEGVNECKKAESQLKNIMDQDDKEVKESKIKVDKARKDVENCQQQCKKHSEDLKFTQSQLDRIRQNYRELSSSYEFFNDLDEVEKMTLASDRNHMVDDAQNPHNSSMLDTSLLNASTDSNRSLNFRQEIIFKTEPYQDISTDLLESFIQFSDRISGMITTETTALKKMEGGNLEVINEFRNKYGHYKERLRQFDAVRQRQEELKKIIDHLKGERLALFRQGFSLINSKLKQVYQHLTRGGDAELQLIDSLDPFSDGVNFSVRPPKKTWKQVNKLSGGEKTLSSLSLIFALHYYKPTPLYFMDEIDAALDFKNVSIVADYIKKRTKDAQFIIISLRNNMFDLANKLIGIYKIADKTKTIKIEPAQLMRLNATQKENNEPYSNRF